MKIKNTTYELNFFVDSTICIAENDTYIPNFIVSNTSSIEVYITSTNINISEKLI